MVLVGYLLAFCQLIADLRPQQRDVKFGYCRFVFTDRLGTDLGVNTARFGGFLHLFTSRLVDIPKSHTNRIFFMLFLQAFQQVLD